MTQSGYVYDKAKFHDDEVAENGLPDAHAYHHTTFFLSWLVKNELMSEFFEKEAQNEVAEYRAGTISINELYEWWDTCLISDMLNEEGNAFAMYYFDFDQGAYLKDHEKYLQKDLPTTFHVLYTHDNEVLIHGVISQRYEKWKQSQKK